MYEIFEKKDLILKSEYSLRKNLKKKRKNLNQKLRKKMTVLSDRWIKKRAQKGMIRPFINKQIRKGKFHMVYRLMDMMQSFK